MRCQFQRFLYSVHTNATRDAVNFFSFVALSVSLKYMVKRLWICFLCYFFLDGDINKHPLDSRGNWIVNDNLYIPKNERATTRERASEERKMKERKEEEEKKFQHFCVMAIGYFVYGDAIYMANLIFFHWIYKLLHSLYTLHVSLECCLSSWGNNIIL